MFFEQSLVVLYVNDLTASSTFYQLLLGISPESPSATFTFFRLANGIEIALKDRHSVVEDYQGIQGCELAFTVKSKDEVDAIYTKWQKEGIQITQKPEDVCYGYNFTAADLDGTKIRVCCIASH